MKAKFQKNITNHNKFNNKKQRRNKKQKQIETSEKMQKIENLNLPQRSKKRQ